MFIIVKNINAHKKIEDIAGYVEPAMRNGFFLKRGMIQSIKIILLLDQNRRIVERHGIVKVSDASAKQVVARLTSRRKGVERRIDEYAIRMRTNDRRINVADSLAYPNDRRKTDRRRKDLILVTVCEKPRIDASGAVTVLKRCPEPCLECGWKAAHPKAAPRRRAEEVWD